MGEYEATGRNGSPWLFQIKGDSPSPTEMARINAALSESDQPEQQPPAPKEEAPGVMTSFGRGLARGWNEIQAGVDTAGQSLFESLGDPARAKEWEQSAQAQRAERDQYETPQGSFFDPDTSKTGLIAGTMGESAPSMALGYGGMGVGGVAGGYIGGAIGTLLDPFIGPAGTVGGATIGSLIGGEIGGALGYSPQMLNSNAERQIQEHGYVKDWGKAYAATAVQAGIETATDKVGMRIIAGLGQAGKAVGKSFLTPATEQAVKEATDIGVKKAFTIVAKKIGEDAAFHAVSGATEEALQQGMERWQAELPLMDDQAKKEYIENAVMGGIVESIFGAGEGFAGGMKEVGHERAMSDARKDVEAEGTALGNAAEQYAPQWAAKRKDGYAEPPAIGEDPTIDGTQPALPDDFVEEALPPGLKDKSLQTDSEIDKSRTAVDRQLATLGYTDADLASMSVTDRAKIAALNIKPKEYQLYRKKYLSPEEVASKVTPPAAPSSPYAVPGVVGPEGLRLVHGTGDATLTQDRIENMRNTGKGKKNTIFGGLFAHSEQDLTHAENQSKTAGGTPTVYNVDLAPGTKIHQHDGDISTLPQARINALTKQGVGVVAGKDANGRSQFAILQKSAIKDMTPRVAAAASETSTPGPAPTVTPRPDLVAPNATSETSTPVIGSDKIGPPERPYTEADYRNVVNTMGDKGVLSIDKIAKTMGMSRPEAENYFNEMLRRGDAHAAGNKNQYAKVVTPYGVQQKQAAGRPTTRRSREYVVRPVQSADARPHYVEVNGQKVGDRFTTPEEAQTWIDSNIPDADKGNATIGQDDSGTSYSLNEVTREHVPGKPERQIGDTPVSAYQTKEEADAALKDYDPAYSPQSNHWKQKQATEEREARVRADFEREHGPIAAKLGAYSEKVLGKGRVDLGILPRLTNPDAPDAIVEGTSQNVNRTDPDGMKRVIGNLIKLASDLYNPNLSVEERARLMQSVLNHELVHALRSLDLLTPKEWDALYQHAVNKKVPGKTYTWLQRAAVRAEGSDPRMLAEEAIAEMARHYMNDPTAFRNPERSMLQKIADFIKKMMKLSQRHDAADLMDTIFSGGIADRQIGHGGLGPRNQDDVRFSLLKPDNFYLKTARFLDGVTREEAPKNDWIKMLANAGIKDEELKWLGIKDWLQNLPKGEPVHRNDIINYVRASGPKVSTVVFANREHPDLRDAAVSGPRWGERSQTTGDNSYAEVAFTVPPPKGEPTYYDANGHIKVPMSDIRSRIVMAERVPNVLAFARFRDTHENGKRILFIEEIQSDLHQQGSMKGYYSKSFAVKLDEMQQQKAAAWQAWQDNHRLKHKINDDMYGLNQRWKDHVKQYWGNDEKNVPPEQRLAHRKANQQMIAQYNEAEAREVEAKRQHNNLDQAITDANGRQSIPNAPFKTNWEDYVIRRMIRHAAEHGYDGIAWHGSPESVAQTEGYGELTTGQDERGKPTYTAFGGQAKVSPIINRYLINLPRIARALGEPFGVNLDHELGGVVDTGPPPEDWGQTDNQYPYADDPAVLDRLNEIATHKSTFNHLANHIINGHKYMVQDGDYLTDEDRQHGQTLSDKMRRARQINNNRRQFDPVQTMHDAGVNTSELNHVLGWWENNGYYRAMPTAEPGPQGATYRSGQPHDSYRMMFNSEMTGSFETGDQPFFSMVKQRKDQIVADPKFREWFGQGVVTEDDGSPKVVYHYSKSEQEFGRFNRLSHFGTAKAAEDRQVGNADKGIENNFPFMNKQQRRDMFFENFATPSGQHVYPVFLNLRRPLRIRDSTTNHDAFQYAVAMADQGILSEREFRRITTGSDDEQSASWDAPIRKVDEQQMLSQLVEKLEKAGYDGFSYENAIEDRGSTSYVTLHSNQIKSIFNQGKWSADDPDILYSQLQDRGANLLENNDKFKTWFNGSRVTLPDGNPMLLFHGTSKDSDFSTFKVGARGAWFTEDPKEASTYAEENDSQKYVRDDESRDPWAMKAVNTASRVVPTYLAIKNPYHFTGEEMQNWLRDPRNSNYAKAQRDLFNRLRNNGYDGVKWGDNIWVAFHPNQIKSALSNEFSTTNDSFKYSQVKPSLLNTMVQPGGDERTAKAIDKARRTGMTSTAPSSLMNLLQPYEPDEKYSQVRPQYSAAAPTGQRVPVAAPIDQLSEVHNRITYDNLSPVLHKLIDWTVPGSRRKAVLREKADDTIISLQDRMLSVGRLIDRIKKNGGFISNENDVYLRETLYSGQTDAHLTANDRELYKPMLNSIQNLTVTKNDYNEARGISPRVADFLDGYKVNWKHALSELYLYARHAQERNAVMRRRNERLAGERPMQYEAGSGMGDGEAQAVLDWFDSKPFGREFSDLSNLASIRSRMRAIINSTNDVRVNAGLNPDFRTMLHPDGTPVENYEDYVPIRGFLGEASLNDEDMSDFAKTGKGFNIRGKEDYSALGRESMGRDLIAHAVMQNQESIVRAGKNKVTQSFRQLILDNPAQMSDAAEVMQMPRTKYTFDKTAGVVREVVDNSVMTDPTVLKGKVDGQQFYIKLKDPRLVRAMGSKSGLGSNTGLHSLIKGLAAVNRFLAATRTSYNPEFMIANMLRDLQTALINVSETDKKGIHRQIVASVFPALNGVRQSLRSGNPHGEWAKIHEEFRRHGGHTAVFGIRELADTIDNMNKHFGEDVSGPMNKVMQPLRWLGKFVSDYNEAIENGTRLAAYKTLRDKYLEMSGDQNDPNNQLRAKEMAAFAAKNLTINFNMGGESKSVMSAFYMFFNASMQGSMAMINPFIRSRRMKAIWGSVLVAGALQDLLMSLFSPTDDDGKKQYDKIPDYVLEHNMVFMDPFGLSKRGYFKLPMPYLMNGIYNWGRAAARTARGKYTFGQLLNTGGMTMLDSLNPWGGSNSFLNFVAPSIIDPFVDLYMNEDFTGKPIAPPVSPYDNIGENRSQQYWNNTNPAYVTIADWMSRLTGRQGDYIPGKMEYSPNQVEYVTDFLTGGTGTFLARAGRIMYGGATGDLTNMQLDATDLPFARKAYGSITQKNDLQDYVQNRDQVLRIRKALQSARKDGDNDTYMKIMRDYPKEYAIAARVNAIENARKKLGTKIKRIKDNDRLSEERKAEMIKQMKDRQDTLVGRGNEVMAAID